MALLNIKDLSLGYDSHAIIKELNFSVNTGDYLCIIGDNGSGKTTLVKTLLGLQNPISGEIIMGDGLNKTEIGYLPQQTAIQKDFPASVREIVLSGCQGKKGIMPFYDQNDKDMAERKISLMGIEHLANRCYRDLSGGQQQRVLLARALCATQKLLLLDEPVSGLDPAATEDMYNLIKELNNKGIAIIMISHDISSVKKYATHVLHIGSEIYYLPISEYIAKEGR